MPRCTLVGKLPRGNQSMDSQTTRFARCIAAAISVALLVASCSSSGEFGTSFSVVGALDEIPASVVVESENPKLVMADVTTAIEIAGIERPDWQQPRPVADYHSTLTSRPGFAQSQRVVVPFPTKVADNVPTQDEFVDEFGFSIVDIETFAAVDGRSDFFMVSEGPTPPPDLPQIAAGIGTIGEGDDLEYVGRTTARRWGLPHRVATRDDLLGISVKTESLAIWLSGAETATLASDPLYLSIAQSLDEHGVVSAQIQKQEAAYRSPFDATGLGWGEKDGEPIGVMVLAYESPTAAADNFEDVEAALGGVIKGADNQPMTGLVTVDSIIAQGALIQVVVRFPGTPAALLDIPALVQIAS